jgi:chloramphenicol 3-O phosphotransferase
MEAHHQAGEIIILNGAPRAGKSSIAEVIRQSFSGNWVNLGVDLYVRHIVPEHMRPAIGLRPDAMRPDIEAYIPIFYAALYEAIAAHSRLGLNVVVDVGHHDAYSKPLNILPQCARQLHGLPVLFVGVRCSLEVIMQRRNAGQAGREGQYLTGSSHAAIPMPVQLWQRAVHAHGIYDLEVDTTMNDAQTCAEHIRQFLPIAESPTAFQRLELL